MTTFPLKGMLTQEALQAKIHSGEIETILAVFPDLYGRLIGKRITGAFFLDQTADGGELEALVAGVVVKGDLVRVVAARGPTKNKVAMKMDSILGQ